MFTNFAILGAPHCTQCTVPYNITVKLYKVHPSAKLIYKPNKLYMFSTDMGPNTNYKPVKSPHLELQPYL